MEKYIHEVKYYETDKMGIAHHSNHIRWMEEARIWFFDRVGLSYRELEDRDVYSPVLSVGCEYKSPVTFGDRVGIEVAVEGYTGVRLTLRYVMTDIATGAAVLTGTTAHCFVNGSGRLIVPKKVLPDIDAKLKELAAQG